MFGAGYGGYGGMGMGMGGLGMGSSMGYGGMGYGGMGMGGLGMGSGMGMGGSYGTGGMYGSGGGMYGTGGGMLGSNGATFGNNSVGGLLGGSTDQGNFPQQQQQQQSLLPGGGGGDVVGNPASSPINQHASPLPPLTETTEEKGRRLRAERRKERQLIKQQREQRKQIRMQARMEIAGHLTNVLVQTLRSTMEMFAVCFGTYYSMKAVRAFANSQETMSQGQFRRGPMGQLIPAGDNGVGTGAVAAQGATAAQAASAATGKPSRWKTWLLFGALFLLGEVLYTAVARARGGDKAKRLRSGRRVGVTEDEYGNIVTQDEMEDGESDDSSNSAMSLYTSDSDAAQGLYSASPAVAGVRGPEGQPASSRRLFVAAYDYDAPQADGAYLSFKTGDEFVVEDYVEGSWCEAIVVTSNGSFTSTSVRGLVPSNFLRPRENSMKL